MRFWNNPTQWAYRTVLIVVVLWCLGYALWDAHDRAGWRERGVRTTAVVTDTWCGGKGSSLHLDVDGTSRAVLPCPEPAPAVGDTVDVLVDSADASRFILAGQLSRTHARSALYVAAGTGVVLAMLEAHWRRERRLERRDGGTEPSD